MHWHFCFVSPTKCSLIVNPVKAGIFGVPHGLLLKSSCDDQTWWEYNLPLEDKENMPFNQSYDLNFAEVSNIFW